MEDVRCLENLLVCKESIDMNPYLSSEEVVQTFLSQIAAHLEQIYIFTPEDLETIATGIAAMTKPVALISFVP